MQHAHAIAVLTCTGLARDRRRAAYVTITLAITVAAWLLLAVLAAPFVASSTKGANAGISMQNGSQSAGSLPLGYARRIEAIPDAHNVSWMGLQVVLCGPSKQVTINALGGPGAAEQLTNNQVGAALLKRWQADPLAAVITAAAASKCGWQTGQGVEPLSVLNTKIALHVTGVVPGAQPLAFMHFDYINRVGSFEGKDKVLCYLAQAHNPRDNDLLAARIDSEFAHDFPAVNAVANSTAQNAWARFGKVQQLVALVMAAILLCAASVLISVLAHAAAQRRVQFAVLEVLGFERKTLFAALALELAATAIVAAALGVGIAMAAGTLTAHAFAQTTFTLITARFAIPDWAFWWLPAWLAALVAVALVWPATLIARVRPIDYRAI